MNIETLRSEALAAGYLLRPISPIILQTAADVASGCVTAHALRKRHGLLPNTAAMRMLQAERIGLIERVPGEIPEEGRPIGVVWRVANTGGSDGSP